MADISDCTVYCKVDEEGSFVSETTALEEEVGNRDLTVVTGLYGTGGKLNNGRFQHYYGDYGYAKRDSPESAFKPHATNGFAINIWVNRYDNIGTEMNLVTLRTDTDGQLCYVLRYVPGDSKTQFFVSSTGNFADIVGVDGPDLPYRTWAMLSAEWDPVDDKLRIAVDNSGWTEASFTGSIYTGGPAPFNLCGYNNSVSGRGFYGSFDEVGLWPRPLYNIGGFTRLYNSGSALAYADFPEASGSVIPIFRHHYQMQGVA